ncbi:MAG: hypothetical protein ACOYB7_02945 [Mycobacterium sp.]
MTGESLVTARAVVLEICGALRWPVAARATAPRAGRAETAAAADGPANEVAAFAVRVLRGEGAAVRVEAAEDDDGPVEVESDAPLSAHAVA